MEWKIFYAGLYHIFFETFLNGSDVDAEAAKKIVKTGIRKN